MAKTIGNDKAIEFQSELLKTEKMLRNLQSIGIDSKIYYKRVEEITLECQKDISGTQKNSYDSGIQVMQRATAEVVYSKAISALKRLQLELNQYSIYFSSFNYADSIDTNKDYTKEELDTIAKNVIGLLESINASETRYYSSEKDVVEKLYAFAYKVIKLEIRCTKSSRVLAWAKEDSIASNFIEKEVEKDINALDKDAKSSPILEQLLAKMKSEGLSFSYLDDSFIYYLSIQNNDQLLDDIKEELNSISQSIKDCEKELSKNPDKISRLKIENSVLRKHSRRKIIGNALRLIAGLSVIAGIIFGTSKFNKVISQKTTYLTDKEVYSVSEEVETLKEKSYEDDIRDSSDNHMTPETQTRIIEYSPWEEKLFGGYERDITSYDVSDIDYDNLKDYASLDLESLGIKGEKTSEEKETLKPEDLYDEAILEVERLIQSYDNPLVEYDDYRLLQVFLSALLLIIAALIDVCISSDNRYRKYSVLALKDTLIYDIKDCRSNKKRRKKNLETIKKLLIESKQLVQSSEEAKSRFIELYSKYSIFLQDEKLADEHQKLTRIKRDTEK